MDAGGDVLLGSQQAELWREDGQKTAGKDSESGEREDVAERRAERRFTRKPEEVFFASAFSRVALSTGLVFL